METGVQTLYDLALDSYPSFQWTRLNSVRLAAIRSSDVSYEAEALSLSVLFFSTTSHQKLAYLGRMVQFQANFYV